MMRLAVLGSGSAGNSVVISSAGHTLLLDAGFSARQIEKRLNSLGTSADAVDAIVLTHEHQDHCRGAKVLAGRHHIPIYATAGTLSTTGLDGKTIRSTSPFEAEGFTIEPFAIPHDASEPVGLTIEDRDGARVGLVADLGCRSRLAWGRLGEVDCLLIETNHDLGLLRSGPYPWYLKQRIAGRHGHLSNEDAARGVAELAHEGLTTVVLYHLSRTNNSEAHAVQAVGDRLDAAECAAELVVTQQDEPTRWIEVHASRPAEKKRQQLTLFEAHDPMR